MRKFALVFALVFTAFNAAADDAALKVDGDLMIHPNQAGGFFSIAANSINSSATWSWPSLQFTQPYKTNWTNVQAQGPFNIQFDTSSLATQELSFTMNWAQPSINIGQFSINDTVTISTGGATVTVVLDGSCTGMSVQIPSGNWVVGGKMRYDFASNAFVVSWENFSFTMNSGAVPQINVGQCQGPSGLIQTLRNTATSIMGNPSMMQNVMNQAVLNYVQNSMNALQVQLLMEHDAKVKPNVTMSWKPSALTVLPGGLMRVAGDMVLTKAGSTVGADTLTRNYDPSILNSVTASGYVLPKGTLQRIMNYLFSNGELQYRVSSTDVPSFESLMNSRFDQFFVWPDLMQFDPSAVFYFDVGTQAVPQLGAGSMLKKGGSSWPATTPLIVHQWAPAGNQYLPYVDFTAPVSGQLFATMSSGNLNLQMQSTSLNIQATFRPEFQNYRAVDPSISTSMLDSSITSYLNSTPYVMPIPSWQITPGLTLAPTDIQAWPDSFRVPLNFTPSN